MHHSSSVALSRDDFRILGRLACALPRGRRQPGPDHRHNRQGFGPNERESAERPDSGVEPQENGPVGGSRSTKIHLDALNRLAKVADGDDEVYSRGGFPLEACPKRQVGVQNRGTCHLQDVAAMDHIGSDLTIPAA